ncbi:MAG: polyprenyl diphosphate synthase [Gemmatimonadota bacterium]|nr:polyprenyl diphosphate synthase [Gemmatimonadota bacterium]
MDGNGRWAERRGRPRWMGHVAGAHAVRRVVEYAARAAVEQLTLYAFSSDNWNRPVEEVGTLFDLFDSHLRTQTDRLARQGIRLQVIGRRDRLPLALRGAISAAEARTSAGRRMTLRVAIDYSSRAAILASLPTAAALHGTPQGETLLPPVDLLVRTGGERRLSDFLLWESAYAELAFLDVLWPDIGTAHLDALFADYAARDRRFGALPQRATA